MSIRLFSWLKPAWAYTNPISSMLSNDNLCDIKMFQLEWRVSSGAIEYYAGTLLVNKLKVSAWMPEGTELKTSTIILWYTWRTVVFYGSHGDASHHRREIQYFLLDALPWDERSDRILSSQCHDGIILYVHENGGILRFCFEHIHI